MKRVIKASSMFLDSSLPRKLQDYYTSEGGYRAVREASECSMSDLYDEEDAFAELGYAVTNWAVAKERYFEALKDSGFECIPIVTESGDNFVESDPSKMFPAQIVADRVYDVMDEILDIISSVE